jgi:hypothetical protein
LADTSARIPDLIIGPVEVRIAASEVAAYARATALCGPPARDGRVPATFPAIWLWHPRAAAAVAEATRGGDRAPVLTAQRFEYHARMRIGGTYRFEIRRFSDPTMPDRITIEAEVADREGLRVATFSATYLVVAALRAEAAA